MLRLVYVSILVLRVMKLLEKQATSKRRKKLAVCYVTHVVALSTGLAAAVSVSTVEQRKTGSEMCQTGRLL